MSTCIIALLLSSLTVSGEIMEPRPGVDWPQFRGLRASGVADGFDAPRDWDAESGRNIKWKTAIPGLAHASPIVWGDRVYVTTAVASTGDQPLKIGLYGAGDSAADMVEHAFRVYCLDKSGGKVLWERTAHTGVPRVKRHTKATHCNSTPATDGRRVVAFFGSEGLHCYTMDGELRWKKDLGVLDVGPHDMAELQWGFASSPILHDDRVIVLCDVKTSPFLAVLDANDGREIWRVSRDDVCAWTTPNVLGEGAAAQVIVNGCKHMGGYAIADGKETWRMSGGGGIPVPTPVIADGLIFFTSNHRPIREGDPQSPVFAVRATASGTVTFGGDGEAGPSQHVAWMKTGRGSYMQTPLVYRGLVYIGNDNGIATAYDAATGEQKWRQRLASGTGYTASAVAADGKVYYTSEEGDVHVLKAGPEHEQLALNKLGESCLSTPAISEGVLYFRTRGHVVAVGGPSAAK